MLLVLSFPFNRYDGLTPFVFVFGLSNRAISFRVLGEVFKWLAEYIIHDSTGVDGGGGDLLCRINEDEDPNVVVDCMLLFLSSSNIKGAAILPEGGFNDFAKGCKLGYGCECVGVLRALTIEAMKGRWGGIN